MAGAAMHLIAGMYDVIAMQAVCGCQAATRTEWSYNGRLRTALCLLPTKGLCRNLKFMTSVLCLASCSAVEVLQDLGAW
jgi:hypothetical protein